ncbi:MAG: VanZ family protein [Candidatus Omnitrophota bacterium]|nr:VanZ family protein [Candidatus Omnitrophota bacterium]
MRGRRASRQRVASRSWSLGVAAYTVLLAVVSVIPVPFEGPLPSGHLDKVIHLCEYWVLAWLLIRAIPPDRPFSSGVQLGVWLLAAGYGGLLEVAQAMIPWRSGEVLDVAANMAGAALGVWVGPGHR